MIPHAFRCSAFCLLPGSYMFMGFAVSCITFQPLFVSLPFSSCHECDIPDKFCASEFGESLIGYVTGSVLKWTDTELLLE